MLALLPGCSEELEDPQDTPANDLSYIGNGVQVQGADQ